MYQLNYTITSLRLLGWKLIISQAIKIVHLAANKVRGMGRVKCKILWSDVILLPIDCFNYEHGSYCAKVVFNGRKQITGSLTYACFGNTHSSLLGEFYVNLFFSEFSPPRIATPNCLCLLVLICERHNRGKWHNFEGVKNRQFSL